MDGLWGSRDLQFPGAVALFCYIERSQTGINERDSTRGTRIPGLSPRKFENISPRIRVYKRAAVYCISRMQYGPRSGAPPRPGDLHYYTVTLLCSSPRRYRGLVRASENTAPNRSEKIGDNDRGRAKKKRVPFEKREIGLLRTNTVSLRYTVYVYIRYTGLDDIYTCIRIPVVRRDPTGKELADVDSPCRG